MGMAIPIPQSSVGGCGLGSHIPHYLKRLVKASSLLVNCYPVNKFHKKFRLHSRKINVVRCAWTIECLLGSENL